MLKLTITNRKKGDSKVLSFDKETLIIGRQEGSDIQLDSSSVSRQHAEITCRKKEVFITDLGSGNGTLVNQQKIKSREKFPVTSGDQIRIEEFDLEMAMGEATGKFKADQKDFDADKTDAGIIEIRLIKKVLSALEQEQSPSLEIINTEKLDNPHPKTRKFLIPEAKHEVTIGRDVPCDFIIQSNAISRRHAILTRKWGGITIKDLRSKNGTFVNDRKAEEKLLHDGDVIMLGDIQLQFRYPQELDIHALSREYEKDASLIKNEAFVRTSAHGAPGTGSSATGKVHEAEKKNEEETGPPAEELKKDRQDVSAQARASVEEGRGRPPKKKEEPKPRAFAAPVGLKPEDIIPDMEVAPTHPSHHEIRPTVLLPRFSQMERVFLALGILTLVTALAALFYFLR